MAVAMRIFDFENSVVFLRCDRVEAVKGGICG